MTMPSIFLRMSLAPWRSHLSRALHLNRSQPHSRYLQLATVTPQGLPANRTVVFREFLPDTNSLQFVTDSRSQKISHIQNQPWAEACWYFTKTRQQFRLAGKLSLINAEDSDENLELARKIAWEKLSDSARLQFAWPTPGKLRQEETEPAFSPSPPSKKQPLTNFCLLLLAPSKVDILELKDNPQNRYFYSLQSDRTWSVQEINP